MVVPLLRRPSTSSPSKASKSPTKDADGYFVSDEETTDEQKKFPLKKFLSAKNMGAAKVVRRPVGPSKVEKWVFSEKSFERRWMMGDSMSLEPAEGSWGTQQRTDVAEGSIDELARTVSELTADEVDVEPTLLPQSMVDPGSGIPRRLSSHASPITSARRYGGKEVVWYHLDGECSQTLGQVLRFHGFGEQRDIDIAVGKNDQKYSEAGVDVKFVKGATREKDYLFIVFQELLLRNTVDQIIKSASEKDVFATNASQHSTSESGSKPQVHPQPSSPEQKNSKSRYMAGSSHAGEDLTASMQMELMTAQVSFFYCPDKQVVVTAGLSASESPALVAARENIENVRSAVRRDCARGGGAATLMIVLLDGVMDAIFPVLDLYGDAIEGMTNIMSSEPDEFIVGLSARMKTRLNQIRRFNWDARGVFLQLKQDMYGVMHGSHRVQTLIDSTEQVEKETDAYMNKCVGIQQIFGDFQQQRINGTLNALTNLTFAIMPFSALTGLWGMNFQGMPELEWEFGYEFFWILAGIVQLLVWMYIYRHWLSKVLGSRRRL